MAIPPIILASTSPYRRELLQRLGISFDTFSPDIDETRHTGESAAEMVERLAIAKARAAASEFEHGLAIGSDQACIIGDQILGKPGDYDNASRQLTHASGQSATFLTGLCLYNLETGRQQVIVEPFTVLFKKLAESQIDGYLKAEEPYNCAGSFKSEGLGIALFEKMTGDDPNSLIGLPLIQLVNMLKNEGIDVLCPLD